MTAHISVLLMPENNVGADHLTLGYYGIVDPINSDITYEDVREAAEWVRDIWRQQTNPSMPRGIINGTAILNMPNEQYAYVGIVDSQDVEALRLLLVQKLMPTSEHGFLPHMTYSYTNGTPITGSKPNVEVRFKTIRACYGDMRVDYWFDDPAWST